MKTIFLIISLLFLFSFISLSNAYAGGMLNNTNQNAAFLRNPARDAAIGIDGVYSNPAGVSFLDEGYHLSLNWQNAKQERIIHTKSQFLEHELSGNTVEKKYKGNGNAPFIPSFQLAKNKNRWSYQLGFAINGGGGKLEFDNGLGSFESAVGQIAYKLKPLGGTGYDVDSYMRGKQYYLAFTLGASYKINPHVAVYGGLRALKGIADYKADIDNIKVRTAHGSMAFGDFIDYTNNVTLNALQAQINSIPDSPLKHQKQAEFDVTKKSIEQLEVYRNGVHLQSSQTGLGIAPIIGVDFNYKNYNFAAKYEFRTKMLMKNDSTVKQALAIPAINTYIDGTEIREDTPALLALGFQWSVKPNIRLNTGYHHYYDRSARKTYCYVLPDGTQIISNHKNSDLLKHGTNEYLGGIEVDLNDKLTFSFGGQKTDYGLSDAYMSDISFVVDSWSWGLGARYKIRKDAAVQIAYFKTIYDDYKTADLSNTYTRTNNVIAIGYDYDF